MSAELLSNARAKPRIAPRALPAAIDRV